MTERKRANMAWAQEMKNLVGDIKTSHRDRATRIGEIKGATKDILADADAFMKRVVGELKEAAKDLKDFLATSETTRKNDFKTMIGEIQDKIKEIQRDVKDLLSKSEEKRMTDFRSLMKDISNDIAGIKKRVEELKRETQGTIKGYSEERKEAGKYWASLKGKGAAVVGEEEKKVAPKKRARKRGRKKK